MVTVTLLTFYSETANSANFRAEQKSPKPKIGQGIVPKGCFHCKARELNSPTTTITLTILLIVKYVSIYVRLV